MYVVLFMVEHVTVTNRNIFLQFREQEKAATNRAQVLQAVRYLWQQVIILSVIHYLLSDSGFVRAIVIFCCVAVSRTLEASRNFIVQTSVYYSYIFFNVSYVFHRYLKHL